jgi:TRAP-type C4-dicarboxylate transport system substrate-binding protein
MHRMMQRSKLVTVALAVTAALVAGGCSSDGAGGDKAGGAGEPVVLRMANPNGDLNDVPAVQNFVSQVKEHSDGNVRIEVINEWGSFADDAEQQVVRAVAAGKADLGWAGARVFDTMGVTSFQALQAPMLIDSYALQQAVLATDLPGQMLQGLDKIGLRGLGVLADGLRKPVAVKQPVLGAADWRGITFGTVRSQGQVQAIRALGATPMETFRRSRNQALLAGTLAGFEMNLLLYEHNVLANRAPYVTVNVTLWPQMDVLFADPDRLARLTGQQRGWLQQAAQDAAGRSAALADRANRDAQGAKNACQSGARFATASRAELTSLRKAFAPVYASLQQDSQTKAFIQQIQTLKQSTPAEAPLAIPAGCTGTAPEQPAGNAGTAPVDLNGTYRYLLTKEDARKDGEANLDEFPSLTTVKLHDGQVEGGCFGQGATYSVAGDQITFDAPEYGYSMTFTFSVDGKGNLHLTPVPPMDKGDAFQCSSKPWTRIG